MTSTSSLSIMLQHLPSRKMVKLIRLLVFLGVFGFVFTVIHRFTQQNKPNKHTGTILLPVSKPTPLGYRRHARDPGLRFGQPDNINPCRNHGYVNRHIEDILARERPSFLSNYKNPCWRTDGTLRCLPYFHIIGSPKSATTDLFNRIALHPEVVVNYRRLSLKETWYWSWRRYGRELTTYYFNELWRPMSLNAFINGFDASKIEEDHIEGYHSLITGHGDPMDFSDFRLNCLIPQNIPGAGELVWTTPYLIKHINPAVKLVLILRDPIERLYSYYFFKLGGMTSFHFHNDVVRSLKVWTECMASNSERFCLYNFNISTYMKVPLHSSFYSSHLKEWLRVFPREQILVLRTEDYHKDIYGTLEQVYRYLNITSLSETDLRELADIEEMHQTQTKKHVGPMLSQTKQILVDLYRQSTEELAEMLQDSRFGFTDVSFS